MKLQILINDTYAISGFKTFLLNESGDLDLSEIFNNECEEILIGPCVNKIPIDKVEAFLVKVFSKLRKGGFLTMNFISPRVLAMSLCRDEISLEDFNIAVYSNKSLISLDMLEKIIFKQNLSIDICKLNGVGYDVTVTR